MTNEEKATYIANANQCIDRSGYSSFEECKNSASEMAKGKDLQFKEYLEKKYKEASDSYDKTEAKFYEDRMDYINEIINELF